MPLCREAFKQAIGSTIAVMRRDQQIAGLQQLQDQVQGSHPGRRHDAPAPPSSLHSASAKRVTGRIAAARVVVLALLAEFPERVIG